MLLPVKVHAISQKKSCEKNLVKIFGPGDSKVIFTLLIEIIAI